MEEPSAESPSLLYVDPDADAVARFESRLDEREHELIVRSVDSIEAAMDVFEQSAVGCVVTEYRLPDGDGFDLLERIKTRTPAVPVVLYTDDGDEGTATRAMRLGVDGYVRKSADGFDVLSNEITGLLGQYRSKGETPDEIDEFAVLHAATVILSRNEPLDDRLHSLAYTLADTFGPEGNTAVRVSVGDQTVETPGTNAATELQSTSITTTDGTVVTLELGLIDADRAPAPTPDQALFDAVTGLVQAQVDGSGDTEAASQRNQFLRSFLDSNSVVLSIKSADGTYELVNDAFESIFGVSESDIVGNTDWELFPPAVAERLRENDRRVIETGEAIQFQETVRVDGTVRPFLTIKAPLLDDDGTPRAVLAISSDLSEHGQVLIERERILDRMTDAFLAVDDEWRFTFVNATAVDLLGRDEEALLGTELWEVFPEAIGTVFEEQYRYAMAEQETVEFEAHFDPLETTFEITVYPSDSGLSIFARDITEQRRTEQELADSVQALHRLYKIASQPDLEFEEKVERILALGNDRLELPYGFLTRITEEQQLIVTSTGDHELLQQGESCALEESYCRKTIDNDGILAVHDAVEDGWEEDLAYDVFELGSYVGGKVIVGGELYGTLCFASSEPQRRSFSDSQQAFVELASRWVSYELEQRQYRRQLERQNDRLDKFASTVSHDLRNPLTVASGHMENLAERYPDDEDVQEVTISLDRAFTIIEDVLAFARLGNDVVDREQAGLETIAWDAWDRCDIGSATLETDSNLGTVSCDPDRLQQLFENLFRNAVDHGPEGVTVHVGRLDNGVFVEDDGPGFGDVELDRLFEFGYTDSEDGTGFGLAIVEEIAEAHGWSVRAVEQEVGARFEITGIDDITTIDAIEPER